MQKVSTTHLHCEGVQGWVCKACLPTGTWSYNSHCVQTLRARWKLLREEEELGKSTRHLQTRMLWLQERVAATHLRVVKVATESNPADMLTKALGRSTVEEFCAEIGQSESHAKTVDKKFKEVNKLN